MGTVTSIITRYTALYTMLDRMLAGEHRNDKLRRAFAEEGKRFLDDHFTLAAAPYSVDPQSDYAILMVSPELRKQVARVASGFRINEVIAKRIPIVTQHSGREMDKVTELLNSPERLRMLRLIRNPAMVELARVAAVRALLEKNAQGDVLKTLDRLNAADAGKPGVDELPVEKRLDLIRRAIAAPEENGSVIGGFFRKAASALVPDGLLRGINDDAEKLYREEQATLEAALRARKPQAPGTQPA